MINLTLAFLTQVIMVLIAVAYLTLLERKIMASIQRRRGPNVVGILGLLQPFADGLKLFTKEMFIPVKANRFLFVLAPTIFLAFSIISWALIPLTEGKSITDLNLGLLFVLTISAFSVYGLILGGWASNSQYAFLGALRSAAQMLSYEISLSLLIFTVILLTKSLNLTAIITIQENLWLILPLFPVAVLFFISALAETSRPPFDLPEAEAELVAGYNVEYSAMGFAFFFIAEYMNIIFMCFLTVILFFGGWLIPFGLNGIYFLPSSFWLFVKAILLISLFIWIRASFPRFRYDQLINLCWRIFLPLSFSSFILTFNMVSNVKVIDEVTLDMSSIIGNVLFAGSALLIVGGVWFIRQIGYPPSDIDDEVLLQTHKKVITYGLENVAKAIGTVENDDPARAPLLDSIKQEFKDLPINQVEEYVGWVHNVGYMGLYGITLLIFGTFGFIILYKYPEKFVSQPKIDTINIEIIPTVTRPVKLQPPSSSFFKKYAEIPTDQPPSPSFFTKHAEIPTDTPDITLGFDLHNCSPLFVISFILILILFSNVSNNISTPRHNVHNNIIFCPLDFKIWPQLFKEFFANFLFLLQTREKLHQVRKNNLRTFFCSLNYLFKCFLGLFFTLGLFFWVF